ncbi:MAG TPA: hypothetical protein VHK64_02905 [Nocardioidaceae bacterium]|nr:hypothetical protein [Nocardioidaceae bacterium]
MPQFAVPGAPNPGMPAAPPQFVGTYTSPFDSPDAYPPAPYPQAQHGQAQHGQAQYGQAQHGQVPYGQVQYGQPDRGTIVAPAFPALPPVAPPPVAPPAGIPAAPAPVVPTWDQAGRTRPVEPPTSPIVVVAAIIAGLLVVGAVGWFTLGGDDEATSGNNVAAGARLTETVPPSGPGPGQTKDLADGWVTYRVPDGAWMFDLPAVPTLPTALPSNPTVQVTYAKGAGNRFGFGWSQGQLAPGTDEGATLVEIMKGIAASRGAGNISPTVLNGATGPIVTATLDLTGGKALFVLRSVDRRPILAMVVAGLGEPDPAIANRMLDSFRPAG